MNPFLPRKELEQKFIVSTDKQTHKTFKNADDIVVHAVFAPVNNFVVIQFNEREKKTKMWTWLDQTEENNK